MAWPRYAIAKAVRRPACRGLCRPVETNEAFCRADARGARAATGEVREEDAGRAYPVGEIRRDRLNVNGGAIAPATPSASGARLADELEGTQTAKPKRALLCLRRRRPGRGHLAGVQRALPFCPQPSNSPQRDERTCYRPRRASSRTSAAKTADAIAVLTFDCLTCREHLRPRHTEELNAHLDAIERDSTLRGVVLNSAKPGIHRRRGPALALHGLMNALRDGEFGQRVQPARRARCRPPLRFTCPGGGFEVCPRATPLRHAGQGHGRLPEVQLGILPAWGGSTRSRASSVRPKRSASSRRQNGRRKQALKLGVDDLVPHESFAVALAKVAKAGHNRIARPRWR